MITRLSDGTAKSIRDDDVVRIAGNSRNTEQALVAFVDRSMVGIIDPVSSRSVEIARPKQAEIRAGDHVSIIRDGDSLIIVR